MKFDKEKIIKIIWKTYYWSMILLTMVSIGGLIGLYSVDSKELSHLFNDENIFSNLYDAMFILIFIVSFVGLRGFIYEKKYFTKDFWIFIFFMVMVDYIGSMIYDYTNIEIIIIAFLFLPLAYALYKYVFKMNYIWEKQ